jgi:hypothetical protein
MLSIALQDTVLVQFAHFHIAIHKHTEPRTASIATVSLHRVPHMHHIPVHASNTTRPQRHAPKELTENKQVYSTWPSVGKDNPGRKLEPLDLASTPRDARYAIIS